MPKHSVRWTNGSAKGRGSVAWLYRLDFPDGTFYIGCTTQSPVKRLYQHLICGPVSVALSKHNEVSIKILAIGEPDYIFSLERKIVTLGIGILNSKAGGSGQRGRKSTKTSKAVGTFYRRFWITAPGLSEA